MHKNLEFHPIAGQLMQQLNMEDALIEIATIRRFAGIDLINDRIHDETTILVFQHLLKRHEYGQRIFETVKVHLKQMGMAMKQVTIINANLISAPSSIKTKPVSGTQKCIRP